MLGGGGGPFSGLTVPPSLKAHTRSPRDSSRLSLPPPAAIATYCSPSISYVTAGADAPAVTYEIDGEQYVAIAAGGGKESRDESRGDLVWAFKLGGTVNPLNGPPPPPSIVTWDGESGRLGPLVSTTKIY